MFLLDIQKDNYHEVAKALQQFFRHNGRVGRTSYVGGALKLTTSGYVMKYIYKGEVYQVEAQYRGKRLFADFMAMPSP